MHVLFDSSWLRAGLRIYFVIVLLLVAILGDTCLHQRTKLKLLKGEQVQVTSMTGWLRGPSFVKTALQLRRLPGGFLGLFMITTAVLALLADLAVSGFVKTVYMQSRCKFGGGLRIDQTPAQYPSNVGTPALWATNAQSASYYNGGYMGIYHKTDNSSYFSAELEDLAANWTCSEGQDFSYKVPQWQDEPIARDLMSRGILLDALFNYQNLSTDGSDLSTQLVIMTTDAKGSNTEAQFSDTKAGAWNARFAVDTFDDASGGTKYFRSFDCKLVDYTLNGTVTNVIAQIDIAQVMGQWIRSIQGKLWDGFDSMTPVSDQAIILAWMLNTMTMVSGSTNSIYYNSTETQGCLRPFTTIPWPVILCFMIATFLFLFFFFYLIWLFVAVHSCSRTYDKNAHITTPGGTVVASSEIRKNTPNGLLDWMQHAVQESGTTEKKPRTHHLSKWLFSTRHHGGKRLGVISRHMSMSSAYLGSSQGLVGSSPGSSHGLMGSSHGSDMRSPPTPETIGLFPEPSPSGSSYFPRKPIPISAWQHQYDQLPKQDYWMDAGAREVRPAPRYD